MAGDAAFLNQDIGVGEGRRGCDIGYGEQGGCEQTGGDRKFSAGESPECVFTIPVAKVAMTIQKNLSESSYVSE